MNIEDIILFTIFFSVTIIRFFFLDWEIRLPQFVDILLAIFLYHFSFHIYVG